MIVKGCKKFKKTVWLIYGTRPEVIKLSPVAKAIEESGAEIEITKVFTGQHGELATALFESLDMVPDSRAELMREGQQLEEFGARCLKKVGGILRDRTPDLVLVQGDTGTAMYGALVSFCQRIPVGHVEAGLRTGEKYRPFPEEVYRRLISNIATLHFAPTNEAADNLYADGVTRESVHVTGNTVVDAVRSLKPEVPSGIREEWLSARNLVLVTLHRRESFDGGIARVAEGVRRVAQEKEDVDFVFPVHPNPEVRRQVYPELGNVQNIHLVEPFAYRDFLYILGKADIVLTDSGGIQEEAPALNTRVLVARDVTERPEGIAAGYARLVGTEADSVESALRVELVDGERDETGQGRPDSTGQASTVDTPYGDGRAGRRIADIVRSFLLDTERVTNDWGGVESTG